MCVDNASVSTRKKVLWLVHEVAIEKANGVSSTSARKTELNVAIDIWIDELAKAHKPNSCKTCGHKF